MLLAQHTCSPDPWQRTAWISAAVGVSQPTVSRISGSSGLKLQCAGCCQFCTISSHSKQVPYNDLPSSVQQAPCTIIPGCNEFHQMQLQTPWYVDCAGMVNPARMQLNPLLPTSVHAAKVDASLKWPLGCCRLRPTPLLQPVASPGRRSSRTPL